MTALTVTPAKDGHYTLSAGERRLIAAKRARSPRSAGLVRVVKGSQAASLIENLINE